jgi:hypothetical protein
MHIGLGIRMSGNRGAGGGFSPNALFASGEAGDWFDPSDLSRMWQDTAGTTPVTADGQTVARIDGQRGVVSLRQSDAAKRPAYKTSAGLHWLQFDGTNDALASAATLNLTGTEKLTVCSGVRKAVTAAGMIAETSGSFFGTPGSFALVADTAGNEFYINGSAPAGWAVSFASPSTDVLTLLGDIAGATRAEEVVVRRNGTSPALIGGIAGPAGTGNFGNHTLFVGARNQTSFYFNGNIYFILIRGALTAGADLTALEGFAAAKTGVTLP